MNDIELALEDLDTLIEIARQHMTTGSWLGITQSVLTIKNALEKQISYTPIERKGFEGKCKCGVVFLDRLTNYCGNCGQKLDWQEV